MGCGLSTKLCTSDSALDCVSPIHPWNACSCIKGTGPAYRGTGATIGRKYVVPSISQGSGWGGVSGAGDSVSINTSVGDSTCCSATGCLNGQYGVMQANHIGQ